MNKFSVIIAGQHTTSISLEDEFYEALTMIAKEQNRPLNALITEIDSKRTTSNLSSALRLFVLKHLQEQIKTQR